MLRRLLPFALAITAGCASNSSSGGDLPPPTPLRLAVENFNNYFALRVERAADEIMEHDESPAVNRATVFWKMRVIPWCREFLVLADDEVVLFGMWMLAGLMKQFFEEGEGKDLFGTVTPVAVNAAGEIDQQIRALAQRFMSAEKFAAVEKSVGDFATNHPISANFEPSPDNGASWTDAAATTLDKPSSLVTRPLSLVNPTSGLSDTASALHRVAATVDALKAEVDYAPANMRWQTDLLILELQESQAVMEALKGLNQIGEGSASIAATASALPAALREEASKLLDDVDDKQAGLQATLASARAVLDETRTTVEEVDKTLGRVEAIVGSTDTASQSLTKLMETLTVTIETFTRLINVLDAPTSGPPPPGPPTPPFDINNFGSTADKLTETMKALGQVLAQVQDLTKPEQTQAIVDTADTAVQSTIDRLLLSGGLFVIFVAAVALGYRWLSRRIMPRAAA